MDTRQTPNRRQQQQSTPLKTQYLVYYNLVSALLWLAVLGRVLLLVPLVGYENVYGGVGEFVKWTQTLAAAEIVHSAIGLVRSPLTTTIMQVFSRLFLIYPVIAAHPDPTTPSIFYTTMLLAWSVTEVIRYGYFVLNLQSRGVPGWLVWLRYNTFYVLYPVGISSECVCIWRASRDTEIEWERWGFWAVLGVYVPGMFSFSFNFGEEAELVCRIWGEVGDYFERERK